MKRNKLKLEIVYRPTIEIRTNPRNARAHSRKQIAQVARSIETFGHVSPILIDEGSTIIAGHARHAAALQLGMDQVPTIQLSHLTESQKRALAIADNKLSDNSEWNVELLAEELKILSAPDFELDVSITGFETAEIDLIIGEPDASTATDKADAQPGIDRSKPAVTRPGDLWVCGEHRVFCGDALDPRSYDILMPNEVADAVFQDPPYNVPVNGHVSGLGSVRHEEFAMAAGEMSEAEFTAFLARAFAATAAKCRDGALVYTCMDWRHMAEILMAGRKVFIELKNVCVWNKTNGGMGSFYRSKHELVFVHKVGTASHINNIDLGRQGRYRTNVWDYAGVNAFGRGRKSDLATHPTVKPVALVADAAKDCTHRNGIVLDPFGGSGTTMLAAERTGRKARLIELDPYYVDAAVTRWTNLSGKIPELIRLPGDSELVLDGSTESVPS